MINSRILKDSVTYSWEKANEFMNGLIAEGNLKVLVLKLKSESHKIQMAYEKSEARNISYQDTIVPALETIIVVREGTIKNHEDYEETLVATVKRQSKKKWVWLGVGTAIGIIIMTLFGG